MNARKAKPATPTWTSGDRVGCLSKAMLRELRMRSIVAGEAEPDVFTEVTEALEEFIDVVGEVSGESHLVVEELADKVKEIAKSANDEVESMREERDDAVKANDEQRERHLEELKECAADSRELVKRAELAEHNLAEAVRNGHAVDLDAGSALREARAANEAAEARIAGLETTIASLTYIANEKLRDEVRKVRDEAWAREKRIAEEARVAKALLDRQAAKIARLQDELERRTEEAHMLSLALDHARAARPVKSRKRTA